MIPKNLAARTLSISSNFSNQQILIPLTVNVAYFVKMLVHTKLKYEQDNSNNSSDIPKPQQQTS